MPRAFLSPPAYVLAFVLAFVLAAAACGSSSPAPTGGMDAAAGTSATGQAGAGAGGASGRTGSAGSSSTGAGGASGTSGAGGGGPSGTQPLGSACANTGNCSQADGAAVCCTNTCVLQGQCPSGTNFLACASAADCAKYGGGKVCCEQTAGGVSMSFCTKP